MLRLRGGAGTADISTQGAEPHSVRDATGHELLWQAGAEWRRHAPILFPIVGRVPDDTITVGGARYPLTQHGFARDLEWDVVTSDGASATLVLRIPAKSQTATLTKLRALGEVQEVQISSTDVTGEVADIEGRITALEASVERLTGLLATADDTDALVSIESSLSSRQAELESLQSQQRALGDKVSLSTITLRLVAEPLPPKEPEANTFFTGLTAGWESFVGFIIGLTVVFGALLPWLVFLGILGAVALVIYRRRRTKKAHEVPTA